MAKASNKQEFLDKLRSGLQSLPLEEREEALSYYQDYFEDAGPEQEQAVLQKLGAPEAVAKTIVDAEEEPPFRTTGNEIAFSGSTTPVVEAELASPWDPIPEPPHSQTKEGVYRDLPTEESSNAEDRQQTDKDASAADVGGKKKAGQNKREKAQYYKSRIQQWMQEANLPTWVLPVAIICSSPIWAPVVTAIAGFLLSWVVGLFAAGLGFLVAAVILLIQGGMQIGASLSLGLLEGGAGLLLLGLAIFAFLLWSKLCFQWLPTLIRGIRNLFRSLSTTKGEEA